MPHPNESSQYGIWSLNDVRNFIRGSNWPGAFGPFTGTDYANSYVATTGGTIVTASPGSLNSLIDGRSDGDVLLLADGTYTLTSTTVQSSFFSDPFRGKNILICGATSAENVIVELDHTGDRDKGIFVGATTSYTPTVNRQMAFITCKRLDTSATSYINSLVRINGNPKSLGRMVNCYFDNNNGNISWHYDNDSTTGSDVQFIRCTFANYNTWQASYTGRDDQVTVGSCLFANTTDQTEYVDGGGNVFPATVNTTTRTYDTATYPTAGHLYVPNATAVF